MMPYVSSGQDQRSTQSSQISGNIPNSVQIYVQINVQIQMSESINRDHQWMLSITDTELVVAEGQYHWSCYHTRPCPIMSTTSSKFDEQSLKS